MPNIEEIRKRLEACPIPEGAQADWKNTRHFEIQTPAKNTPFWWLEPEAWQLAMLPHVEGSDEAQERCGAVLDYATAYRGDVTALLAAIEEAKNEAYRECARLQCYACRNTVYVYKYAGTIRHYSMIGKESLCQAADIRQRRPQAFEKP